MFRHPITLILTLGALALGAATLGGCLADGAGTEFIDESLLPITDPLDSGRGDFCRASADCIDDLRCLRHEGDQFCVGTCQSSDQCPGQELCLDASDPNQGWCGEDPFSDEFGVGDDGDDFAPAPDNGGDDDVPQERPDASGCGTTIEAEQFRLVNIDRAANGLPALRCDPRLAEVAREHSRDMAARDFFDHTNPDGEQPWDRMERHGLSFRSAGENIAMGYPTPQDVQEGWMNSPGHRANILGRDYTHIGVGVFNDNGTLFWTQVFASF